MIKILFVFALVFGLSACGGGTPSSDQRMVAEQERSLQDGVSAVGMPAIKNWREKRQLKMIYELRDQEGLRTYTYLVAQNTGKREFLCDSLGFPINDATGFSSPEKIVKAAVDNYLAVVQAEPNGLFTPDSGNSYWVMCLDTEKGKPSPTFVTGNPLASLYKLP